MIKPILFNTGMVRAILDGRKTVTRRIIKPHNLTVAKENGYRQGDGLWIDFTTDNPDGKGHIKDYSVSPCWSTIDYYIKHYAPYKQGDILYVRETWCKNPNYQEYYFRTRPSGIAPYGLKWRPSIHMPKEVARIWLKVTDVRVERLQDITDEQAKAEGIGEEWAMSWWKPTFYDPDSGGYPRYRDVFAHDLWDSTIKKSDLASYGWEANPWVWAIEFERCEKPEEV